jgi:hypothetical protein
MKICSHHIDHVRDLECSHVLDGTEVVIVLFGSSQEWK